LATGSLDGSARIWLIPAVEGNAERVGLWSQMTTGVELTPAGVARPLTADEWRGRGQKLKTLIETPQR
jgi:hypothetical protein